MTEIRVVVERKDVNYNGLFLAGELFGIIRRFGAERMYFIGEKNTQEDVFESGKHIKVEMEGMKIFNDYVTGKISVSIEIRNLKDKTVVVSGHKQKFQHGEVSISLMSFLETDRRSQFEGSGFQFVLRTLSDKFIRRDFIVELQDTVVRDTNELAEEIRSYLNMTRFTMTK
jgi:hypothetical protein